MLVEQAEGALLGLVALAGQVLQSLLAGGHLLAADDATVLVLHEVLLLQTTGSVLGSAVEHLSLGTNSNHLGHLISVAAIFKRGGLKVTGAPLGSGGLYDAPFRCCNRRNRVPTTTSHPPHHNDQVPAETNTTVSSRNLDRTHDLSARGDASVYGV